VKHLATGNYRWEAVATPVLAGLAAALFGWALALMLGVWADSKTSLLTPWSPFVLSPPNVGAAPVGANVAVGNSKLVGVAGERAYFVNGVGAAARTLSLQVGDALPTGEKVRRIERDGVTMTGASGDVRLSVLPPRAVAPAKAVAGVIACRLSATERASAIFIEPSVVKALGAEKATFARMFDVLPGPGGGIRAKGTGGTTAMFAIEDGDVWTRVDGAALRSSDAIVTDVLARVGQGASVVVEGERKGAPRRWVYAPVGCGQAAELSSASKSKG
jgi:hypothetical protein